MVRRDLRCEVTELSVNNVFVVCRYIWDLSYKRSHHVLNVTAWNLKAGCVVTSFCVYAKRWKPFEGRNLILILRHRASCDLLLGWYPKMYRLRKSSPIISSKFFCFHIVIAYARGMEQVDHCSDHSRRPRYVVDGPFEAD